MNRTILFLLLILLISCDTGDHLSSFKATHSNNNRLYISFRLSYDVPSNLGKNLKMFSSAEMEINIDISDPDKKTIASQTVYRSIKYDRWNEVYSMKDSFSDNERTFSDFLSMKDILYEFSNIPFDMKSAEYGTKKLCMTYGFTIKSVEFDQPFKFIEFYLKTDNMKSGRNKKYFYVENG